MRGERMTESSSRSSTLIHEGLTGKIIGAAIEVHRSLGPGLLESAYEECLAHELATRGLSVRRQVGVPAAYKSHRLDCGYRIDLLVADTVILELKAVDRLQPIHEAQLLTYLKLMNLPIGFIINFNVTVLKDGIVRRALTQHPDSTPRASASSAVQ